MPADGFFLLFQTAYQRSQLIVNLIGLQIVRIHLVDRCYDPLCLKLRQNQHTKHNENTHGNHDRNGMENRGQCAFCGTCYPDHASIAQTGCIIIGLLRKGSGCADALSPAVFECRSDLRPIFMIFKAFTVCKAVVEHRTILRDPGDPVLAVTVSAAL